MNPKNLTLRRTFLAVLLSLCVTIALSPTVMACSATEQDCNGRCIGKNQLCILEPFPGMPSVIDADAVGGPLGLFFYYINSGVWQWAFKVGVAVAVLNGTAGGFQIVTSNGDSGKSEAGKQRFLWSAIGLVILLLSSTILVFLNPVGFQAV